MLLSFRKKVKQMPTGTKIKEIRKQKGLTQKQLGDLCGMADSAIRRYENGNANPKIETLKKISSALEVPLSALLSFEEYMKIWKDEKEIERITSPTLLETLHPGDIFSTEDITEHKLISDYRQLNDNGKTEALKRVEELTEMSRYTKLLSGASAAKSNLKTDAEFSIIEPPEDNN